MFTMEGGRAYTNRRGQPLFPIPNTTLMCLSNPSNWVYDDDINEVLDEDEPRA